MFANRKRDQIPLSVHQGDYQAPAMVASYLSYPGPRPSQIPLSFPGGDKFAHPLLASGWMKDMNDMSLYSVDRHSTNRLPV